MTTQVNLKRITQRGNDRDGDVDHVDRDDQHSDGNHYDGNHS